MVDATNRIDGEPRSVRDLLQGCKYALDYYQREYAWERKQIAELLDDLESRFLSSYDKSHERRAVEGYRQYFLGSVVISHKGTARYVIDGQQRLTLLRQTARGGHRRRLARRARVPRHTGRPLHRPD